MAESLFLNKIKADLNNKPITRKIQIGEVSEVAERKSSFSYTISLPRTSRNIQLFDMLGTVANTSRKPYESIVADYIVDGVYLVLNGSAIIRETSDSFQLNIIDGIRSLAESLKDKKLIDLPLDDLNHIITSQAYVDSFQNTEGFIYGIANFGRGVSETIKVEKQAPSIFVHTLFRRIFESNGLSLQGEFFTTNEKYLSEVLMPSRGYLVEFGTLETTPKGGADSDALSDYQLSNDYISFERKFTMSNVALVGASIVSGNIVFSVAGTYKLDLSVVYSLYKTYGSIIFQINGSSKSFIFLQEGNSLTKTQSLTFTVEAGDVVSIWISGGSSFDYEDPLHSGYTVNYSATVEASLYLQEGGPVVKASDYIGDMNQLDFIKDVVNRYGLVLHPVQNTGEFKFRRLEALLNDRATAEDWTSRLSSIDSEKYVSGYAKANKANYSYPEATVVPTHDGTMIVDNENTDAEKQMFSSPFEIPVQSGSVNGQQTFLVPVWGEESQGLVEVETELNKAEEVLNQYLKTDGSLIRIEPSSVIADKFIQNSGSLQSVTGYTVSVFAVNEGEKFNVVGTVSGQYFAFWAFYEDEACSIVVSVGDTAPAPPIERTFDSAIVVPAGANYIGMTGGTVALYNIETAGHDSTNFRINKYENIDTLTKTYKATGRIKDNDCALVCFYDINDIFISYQFAGSGIVEDYAKTSLFVPSNCKIIRISGHSDFLPVLYDYEQAEYITAVNEETPLKIMHINRQNLPVTAYFYNEVTGVTATENIPYLNLDFISMQYFLGNFYKAFQNMIENYKKVSLKVNLSTIDIFNLDFFRLKFLKQTGRFYYLDSVQHTAGKISSVEAIEIKEFPVNQPPSQIGNYSFSLNHGSTVYLTLANLATGYEDPELDLPLKIKIISGFNSDILLKQDGVTITAETEINVEDLALTAVETIGGLAAYSKSWVFAIADAGSGSFGYLTGTLTANVIEVINTPPTADAGIDQVIQIPFPEVYPARIFATLNGSASSDYTGEIISYFWEIITSPAGSTVVLSQTSTSSFAYLEGDNIDENIGNYVLRLTVADQYGLTDTDEVQVTVQRIHY